ncbi:pyridoxal-phosphate dependent enzyme [Aureimonas pseudogalii]|uniref:Threonine dehydratase n=1 Tax=Aureimonas pseudogalii TaxID=1744844 RepID=A0A7W6MLU8_9HYPH|nr:pyridoxal-phosphate dependent enzyme [Aureimonas pseudogalii]MBB4000168.1 threonine dehydratase [Aureimonas pseudogalii]
MTASLTDRLTSDLDGDLRFIAREAHSVRFHEAWALGLDQHRVRLIDETRQRAGSFKYRGASLAVRNASAGIVASGSGNFPIAIGCAAARAGCLAVITMPEDAPASKRDMAQRSGAEVIFAPRSTFTQTAAAEADARGWRLVHPFRSPEMLIGSCSLGLEMADAVAKHGSSDDAIVVACGGGGLAAGIVLGLRMRGIANQVYVVEPASYPSLEAALTASHPIEIVPSSTTICDALRVSTIGDLAFEVLSDDAITPLAVSDEWVEAATNILLETCGVMAEPSGAIALAASISGRIPATHQQSWVVVCGGNR